MVPHRKAPIAMKVTALANCEYECKILQKFQAMDLRNLEARMFYGLPKLTQVRFQAFHYCFYVPHAVNCHPKGIVVQILSCLRNKALQILAKTFRLYTR